MIKHRKPFYEDDRQISMAAFVGPRQGGKRYYNGEYGANPRDPKEDYPCYFTDEMFALYKEAGFSFVMPEADAFYGKRMTKDGWVNEPDFLKTDLYQYMKIAETHGLDVYPSMEMLYGFLTHDDGSFTEKEKAYIYDFISTIQKHYPKTFKGILLTDEPGYRPAGRIKKIIEYIRSEEIKNVKPELDVFGAFLPSYADICRFHPDYEGDEYKEHYLLDEHRIRAYKHYLALYADIIGEFSFDFYPLWAEGKVIEGFYHNLEMAAEYGKEKNIPISVTLQSFRMDAGYNPKLGHGKRIAFRTPCYEDIRWQVYAALAYGVKRIVYFTFWQHFQESDAEVFPKAMINYEPSEEKGYRKTEIYYAVKEVNEEILAIDHVFMRYQWRGTRTIVTSRARNIRNVKGDYDDGVLGEVKASRDLLIGCFENSDDKRKGYWIVNAQNPYYFEMNDVKTRFKGADRIVYYRKGREYDIPLEEETFSVRLGVGEGIFVIPYKE